MTVRVCTLDRQWYVAALPGVSCVHWVQEKDRSFAASFPQSQAERWVLLLEEMSGRELMSEEAR